MNKYNNFKSSDFIEDRAFRDWVYGNKPKSTVDWEGLCTQNPALRNEIETAKLYLKNIEDQQPAVTDAYIQNFGKAILRKHNNKKDSGKRQLISPWYQKSIQSLYLAAAVAVAFGVGWFYCVNSQERTAISDGAVAWNKAEEKLINRYNQSQKPELVVLSDGSKVTLQPNSSITYPEAFNGKERHIQLEGEAFFDVTKNRKKPFLVYFNNLTVKVLGTSFNIRSYGNEDGIKVTVKTGKVSVFKNQSDIRSENNSSVNSAVIMLTANQEVSYKKDRGYFERSVAASTQIIDKTISEQDFVFSDTPLNIILSKLEKAYGIPIIFDEEQIHGCSLTASLADEPLLDKLNMICKTMDASYEMVDGQIVMNIKSCRNADQ